MSSIFFLNLSVFMEFRKTKKSFFRLPDPVRIVRLEKSDSKEKVRLVEICDWVHSARIIIIIDPA